MGHTSAGRGINGTVLVSSQDMLQASTQEFLGKCRQSLRQFWSYWVHLGYGPALGPTFKKALVHTHLVDGRSTNTVDFN